jgi:hypothetical protein
LPKIPKPDPLLLVYKELTDSELKKLQAISNVTQSGGGARDLRLPAKTFRPVMNRIFTGTQNKKGKQIRTAKITYRGDDGTLGTTELEYWPPTDARPREDRVARVHASPALGGRLPASDRGRVFVLFIRWSNSDVGCYYAYENDLKRKGIWASEVRTALLSCMAGTDLKNLARSGNKLSVQGYIDFTNGTVYCHAG